MAVSSSAVKSSRSSAPRLSSSWATLLAPMSTEVTRSSRSAQASASWARLCPRERATSSSARTCRSASSVSSSVDSDLPWLAREPSGTPCRYLSVSMPWASGEKAMQPAPAPARVSSSPSRSIQRLSIEYEGWWMSSGVPRSARISAARAVSAAE
jgi:hypothetical protein